MIDMPYHIEARTPSLLDYLHLRAVSGLSPFSPEAARAGLAGTRFAVVVLHEDSVVGTGRLIGDGGCFFQVVDIAVDPDHQGKGLGRAIMAALKEHIDTALPPSAYVSLIADVPADRLYQKFGFEQTAPRSLGMAYRVG